MLAFAHADLLVDEREFGTRVGAENFSGIFRFADDDSLLRFAQHFSHVGEVVLAVGVSGGEFLDVRKQLRHVEDVEAGVNLANLFLGWSGGFFFDDGLDFCVARILSEDAAVAGWIVDIGAKQGHSGLLVEVEIEQAG